MREDSDAAPPPAIGSNVCPSTSDNGLSPGLFSASISFSPAEFPHMSPSAAAAGSLSQFAAASTRRIRSLQTVILLCISIPSSPAPLHISAVAQFNPALGPTWQHNVNVRLVLARDDWNARVAVVGECRLSCAPAKAV